MDAELEAEVREFCETEMIQAIQVQEKHAREDAIKEVKDKVIVANMKNKKQMRDCSKTSETDFR